MAEFREEDYEQVYTPDFMRLSTLIERAREAGGYATMADFAQACSVQPSTFSRIKTKNIKRPLSWDMIKTIADHSGSDGEYFYKQFIRANGLKLKKDLEERPIPDYMKDFTDLEIRTKNAVRDLVVKMFDEDDQDDDITYAILPRFPRSVGYSDIYRLYMPADVVAENRGSDKSYPKYWGFRLLFSWRGRRHGAPASVLPADDYASVFLRDIWEPESLKDLKYSFVVVDRDDYEATVEMYSNLKVNGDISIILLDVENSSIIEEFNLNHN